jgi:RNA polymerase sigma-70 factor (ECF subfamily)
MGSDVTQPALSSPLLWKQSKTASRATTRLSVHTGDSDEQLLARAQLRDREALAELFDRYADLAFAIAFRILRDRGEAEDLVQDIFLKLFRTPHSFDPEKGSARTWVVQFIYRRAFNRRTYLIRRHFYAGTDVEDPKNTLKEGETVDPEEQIADKVTAKQLVAAFEELTEQQRTAIEMHIFQGASIREISERTGESVENVRHDRLKKIAWALIGRRQK